MKQVTRHLAKSVSSEIDDDVFQKICDKKQKNAVFELLI
jgi:hypothetical protein